MSVAPPSTLAVTTARPTELSGWGCIGRPGRELLSEDLEAASQDVVLTRGLGRSYGDSSLPAAPEHKVLATRLANRILSLDENSQVIRCEAGVSLAELNRLLMPRGLFVPVTPGTKFVTVGGMVASDVHGKNHHRAGCFGAHVRSLRMRIADGSIVDCGPQQQPDLFWAAVGGMGLLGHILEVEFRMDSIPSPWIWAEHQRVDSIEEYLAALSEAAPKWPMTVGWIDCVNQGKGMGRGILTSGRWAQTEEAPARPPSIPRSKTVPLNFPNWAINNLTVQAFNSLYYWKTWRRKSSGLMTPEAFFYPLDALLHWNRVYGSRGFTQHQCVLPRSAGAEAVREFLKILTREGCASPICVIKDCGPQGQGLLSFPMEGTSIAVDIGVTPNIEKSIARLNEFVISAGGRIYLTKDQFTRREHFVAMEPRLPAFLSARQTWDPQQKFKSAQSVRLMGDRV